MRRTALAACATLALVACASVEEDATGSASAMRPMERALVGEAAPYPHDATIATREAELHRSIAARRRVGWEIAARVLAPVPILEGRAGTTPRSLPRFRTWLGRDDLERIAGRLRASPSPTSPGAIDEAFLWNAGFSGAARDEDLAARLDALDDETDVHGLGGNARVVYGPALARHLFAKGAELAACRTRPTPSSSASRGEAPSCLGEDLPADAVVVKASWWRTSAPLPTHDTSAPTLAARRRGERDDGGWGRGTGQASPGPEDIHTVRLAGGSAYRLAALHIVTKELRDWVWVTLWWSDRPDEDFGADRPEAIRALGAPWTSYKMAVVTAFDEGDPDARGGYRGSLGDALEAVHEGRGGPTWSSNPYVERGAKNAQTNCIGCHQHAGVPGATSASILADPVRYPAAGRTRLRENFPADYLFALDGEPEALARVVGRP